VVPWERSNGIGDTLTHVNSITTGHMTHDQPRLAIQGRVFATISLGLSDNSGVSRTVSIVRSSPLTSKISWAREASSKATRLFLTR